MKILVVQNPKSATEFENYFFNVFPIAEVRILTSKNTIRCFNNMSDNCSVCYGPEYESTKFDEFLFNQTTLFRPDIIFSNSEVDVLRASVARDLIGIKGQTVKEATAFRDKVAMKKLFSRMSLAAPRFSEVSCLSDIISFLNQNRKIVLKPRMGSGSQGVFVLDDIQKAVSLLRGNSELLSEVSHGQYMVEEFVVGDVYHVDVIVSQNQMVLFSPSKYFHPPHTFNEFNVGSYMLDETCPDYLALQALLTSSLPKAQLCDGIYHFEFFKSPSSTRFIAGEVGSRIGGGLIKDSISASFGVNPLKMLIDVLTGQPVEWVQRTSLSGWLLNTAMTKDWQDVKYDTAALNVTSLKTHRFDAQPSASSVTCEQKLLFSYERTQTLQSAIEEFLC
ncbi:ATP-grasp domain-containing protein [Vibrio europaeus]|uniref:ATP-grasp domain-containing protein n=1 Tax=Vibrio europaeus TaxID=300876 RepID=UPI00233E8CB6|nr:ATP-grasp domain-containing protein [Vibrio europaeus]MDC5807895.1 ATP-grasp domain-containing protein [Vibrio europaeus]MDC5822230.1 ATP-grasp domain-containing protein [Vibrio europaeus]MDC5825397.1 ATP-grasp domain-containing protein [Vibrio europaeus]MDC5832685.1 ATP-grasp domain-containing protein [Vibrio europaeus]MDC5835596.1 ATP-grasp domain-containing protein [Vibrio europaeus]